MSAENQGDGVTSPEVGDQGGNPNETKNEYVKRQAYESLLDETKGTKNKYREALAELNEIKARQKEAEEQKLLEEKNYLQVIEKLKAEKEQIAQENESHLREKQDFRKMTALLSSLQKKGVNVESKYYDLLPMDKISFDDDGNIDGTSLAEASELFVREHPRLTVPIGKLLPNQKSESNSPKMTINEWKKLGPKERREALANNQVKM